MFKNRVIMWFVNWKKFTNLFFNKIRLILKPKKTDRNLINFILHLFEKLQFVKTFLSKQTTTIKNFFKTIFTYLLIMNR